MAEVSGKSILGIDVSKGKLDVYLMVGGKALSGEFENSRKGFKRLKSWLRFHKAAEVHACLEATGSYGREIAMYLYEEGHRVSVVNPLRVKSYAMSKLERNKTDKADARVIAEFCLTQEPERWEPPTAEVLELQALTRRIEVVEEMLRMERNRLETSPKQTRTSIKRMIRNIEKEIKELEEAVKDHIDQNPGLKQQTELLKTIPGIGDKTANMLLSEVEFERFGSARAVAAFAGVTPRQRQSGTSLKYTSVSKLGNRRLRKALYFPAVTAMMKNPVVKEFARRLAKNGKPKMQIVCAAMRKLLHIAFGVLKHKSPFNPNLAFLR